VTRQLPVELLLIIFKIVAEQQLFWSFDWYDFDASSPSLFPFAIAAVCSLWRDVMALVPEFWKRVVIFVDSQPVFPPAAASQLLWSRDVPLEVAVISKQQREDASAISAIMATYINPNLHRITKLRFNVKSSSCLPLFPGHFRGIASKLVRLRLECNRDGGDSAQVKINDSESVMPTESRFPFLVTLFMDVATLVSRVAPNGSTRSRMGMISLSRFTPLATESFPADAFIMPLTAMEHLRTSASSTSVCLFQRLISPHFRNT